MPSEKNQGALTTNIQLSDSFSCKKLLCLTIPSIIMLTFTSLHGVVLAIVVYIFLRPIMVLLGALTTRAFMVYAFSLLFSGIAIFGSSFFTALSDGLTSALISFLRSLLFQVVAVWCSPFSQGLTASGCPSLPRS